MLRGCSHRQASPRPLPYNGVAMREHLEATFSRIDAKLEEVDHGHKD